MPPPSELVLAASVGAAVLYGTMVGLPPSRWRMTVKTASTALLSTASAVRGGPLLLVGALALGSAGDAFLAWHDETSFLCGLASFLVAHMLYIALFVRVALSTARDAQLEILLRGWRATVAGTLAVLVVAMVAALVPRIDRKLRAPVVVYSLVIFVMSLSALTLDSGQVIAGALLFTSSDSILAVDKFLVAPSSPYRSWMQHAVWVLYYSGQLLIASGFLSLTAVAP